ncbi:MAG TPA: 30S ribosomal protein S6 [Labilithrix sp.]|nr:30S ribosomal protein S6 [Labilithrix sp.]
MPEVQILKFKEYETIYVLRSDVDADTAEKVQARVAEVVGRDSGKLVKVEAWGRRKLAYPVAKQKRGVYVYVKYVGRGGLVQEIERNLKLQDTVLKFQTIQTNDEVDVAALTIDPEEVKFQRLELPPEEDAVESREKQLGLIDLGPDAPRSMRHGHGRDGDDDFGDDERGDRGDRGDRAERPAAAPAAAAPAVETDDTAGPAAAAPKAEGEEEA